MIILTLIILVLYLIRKLYQTKYSFWQKLNVQHPKPRIPLGNIDNFIIKNCNPLGMQLKKYYNEYKNKNQRFFGFYIMHTAIFIPVDINLIKNILSRDFTYFDQKNLFVNEKDQPISANLFFIGGEKWKNMRVKLTPTFTSGKMKMMLPILLDCRKPITEHIENCVKDKVPLDIKIVSGKFTIDIIGLTAFGIDCNSFKNPDSDFRIYGRKVFGDTYLAMMKAMFAFNFQDIARKFGMGPFPPEVSEFYTNIVSDAINYRRENNVVKNDFLQMLIKLYDDGQMNFGEVVAQAFVFFIAGFETSSTTMTFCLFQLAQNQDIQDKLRTEIREVFAKYNGEITYESLGELKYMKQVIDETLRKHPPVLTIDRQCSKDYKIEEENIVIPTGTSVIITTYGIHHDPEFYPNPEKFDPDRFSEANSANRNPYTYLPFGEGPRLCIGQRFGIMQTKVGLFTLLKDHRYKLNTKTNPNLEFEFKFVLSSIGDILLDVQKVA